MVKYPVRQYPVKLPLPFPDEAYVDPTTFNKSLSSSACYWEKKYRIHSEWAKMHKVQTSVLSNIRSLVESIDKLAPKLSYEEQVFYNDLNNYLISLMPIVASHVPNQSFQSNTYDVQLKKDSSKSSVVDHLLRQ